MKFNYIIIFFSILFMTRSFAGDYFTASGSLGDISNSLKEYKKINPLADFGLVKTQSIEKEKKCVGCPAFIALIPMVNDILDQAIKNPKFDDEELPREVNRLKMIYYVSRDRNQNGEINCQKTIFQNNIFDRDIKLEGDARLITEKVFAYEGPDSMVVNNPGRDQVTYYFRDPEQKDVLVQFTLEKNKPAKLRYYSYHPTEQEINPYHLPNLGSVREAKSKKNPKSSDNLIVNKDDVEITPESLIPNQMNFDPRLVKKGDVPKDVYLGDATIQKELYDDMLFSANSILTVGEGNKANFKLTDSTKRDYLYLAIHTKLDGKTDHNLVIPVNYSLPSFFSSNSELKGTLQDEKSATTASIGLAQSGAELVRVIVRQNKDTGKNSLVLTHDYQIGNSPPVTLQAGQDEASTAFVGAHYAKSINKKIATVLDVKYGGGHFTFYYTLSSQF
jgi:hypothetical protein